jgi:hypothetical protein
MDLPISQSQAIVLVKWMRGNFGGVMLKANGYKQSELSDLYCAIACQETGYRIVPWINLGKSPADILRLCVLDSSGDMDKGRTAFPRNASEFRQWDLATHGDTTLSDLLQAATNDYRKAMGYGPKPWINDGWGIFQRDLQFIKTDLVFWIERQWCDFGQCLSRLLSELSDCFKRSGGDVRGAVRRYNGSGPAAEAYADNVMQYLAWAEATK